MKQFDSMYLYLFESEQLSGRLDLADPAEDSAAVDQIPLLSLVGLHAEARRRRLGHPPDRVRAER